MTKGWRSGAAWVAQMIAQAIAEQGATIAYVAPLAHPAEREPHHPNLLRLTTPRELVGRHGRLARARASLSRVAVGLWHVLRLRAATRVFLFSIPEPLVFTLPLFALLRLSGARVLLVVHDAQPHAWSLPARLRRVERWAHAASYRLADSLVALTPTVREALIRDFGIPPGKIAVIPHGPFSLGKATPLPGRQRILLFGSLRRNKNVREVIEGVLLARSRGLNVTLTLAGAPLKLEPGYWDECLAAVARDPQAFDMRPGFLPDEALPGLIAEVDAFVLAYRDFNSQSGVGILAAMAGRPVIGTRSGGLGELFDIGMAGEIVSEPVTAETVADALQAFLARPVSEWQERADEAVKRISAHLDWHRIADAYIALARGAAPSQDGQP